MPLESPDQQHWQAAVGYVELGMFAEADSELDKIDPFCRALPEILVVRLAIYRGLETWELMQQIAVLSDRLLVLLEPRPPVLRFPFSFPVSLSETSSNDKLGFRRKLADLLCQSVMQLASRAHPTREAEGVRFELTRPFSLPVFKTGAINRSATPPGMDGQRPTSNVQRPTLNAEND